MVGSMLLIVLFLGGLLLLAGLVWGLFWFLVQAGVIVHEARKPTYTGGENYRLEQGREVGKDEAQKVKAP